MKRTLTKEEDMNDPWFAVAVIEFVLLAMILIPKIRLPKKIKAGRTGVVNKINFVTKGIAHNPVTTLEIQEPNGIFFAAIDGHDINFSNGDKIEFWPSLQNVANQDVPRVRNNEDGTTEHWQEKIRYWGLKKYRIVPEEPKAATA
jgi:hypothetical protein